MTIKKGGSAVKISLIQFPIVPGNRQANFSQVRCRVQRAAADGADLAVLPELWDLSFYPSDVYDRADEGGRQAQDFLQETASSCHIQLIGGSIARRQEGKLYNTTYIVDEEGNLVSSYDKCHLFTPGGEEKVFTPGNHLNTFFLGDLPMASMTCYDLRFGEWARMAALAGAKVLFVPAAWPQPRLEHWQILNRARAIENQFFVAAVNSCGTCGDYRFGGHSLLVDPWGNILAEGGTGGEIVTGDMDLSIIDDIRSRINVFRDRRPELYSLEGKR